MAAEWTSKLHEGIRVEVTVQQEHHDPTPAMRGYYHGVICKLAAEESGYTKDEVDDILCGQFIRDEDGKVQSKADLSDQEFADLIDRSKDFIAINWGVVVPPPDKNWRQRECQDSSKVC